jgi:TRAP-type C4-dicarboxylate transport system substrate-binding protein
MKKWMVLCVVAAVSGAILFAWADQVPAQKTVKPLVIRYGTDLPPHMPPVIGQHWWADEVTKRTEGRVKVQISPASSLVNQAGGLEAVLSGVADMYMLSTGAHRKSFPITSIMNVPGAGFPDDTLEANTAHMNAFFELLKRFPAAAAEYKNFGEVFFYVIYSESYLVSKRKKILVPSDVKGMKVGSNGVRMEFVGRIGAAPVDDIPPLAYEKLMTGVTDATFAAISAWHDFKLYEVTNYVLDVPFGGGGHPIVINKETWNKISPEDQQIMKELALEGAKRSHQALADLNRKSWEEASSKGMKVTPPETERKLWEEEFKVTSEKWIAEREALGIKDMKNIFSFWKNAADKAWAK